MCIREMGRHKYLKMNPGCSLSLCMGPIISRIGKSDLIWTFHCQMVRPTNEYMDILKETLPKLIDQQKPDFIFYLAGVDILATDKLGKLSLSRQACKERDSFVLQQCRRNQIPVQVSMGGGYSADIRDIVDAHCNTFRVASDLYF